MSSFRRLALAFVPVVCIGLVLAAFAAGQPDAPAKKDPAKNTPSTEDAVRDLKRRADAADAKHEAQAKKNEELEAKLADAEKKLGEETAARQKAVADVRWVSPPVGTVVMWWGERGAIPDGWEICDGKEVHAPKAVLTGTKPNFIDRFPKGTVARENLTALRKATGGNNNMPALKITTISGLKVGEEGSEHEHKTPTVVGPAKPGDKFELPEKRSNEYDHVGGAPTDKSGKHTHNLTGYVGSEKGVDADGRDNTGANQPAYQEIFFVIRVK